MENREEIIDMAVHAMTALMNRDQNATAEDTFDESIDIGTKLVAKVEETARKDGMPSRDELMDMGIHALSALLNGRQPANADQVLDETMEVGRMLIAKVDKAMADGFTGCDRDELLDIAVHVQTAVLNARPKMSPDDLSDHCVDVAKKLLAKVDG